MNSMAVKERDASAGGVEISPADTEQHALTDGFHLVIDCLLYTSPSPRDS